MARSAILYILYAVVVICLVVAITLSFNGTANAPKITQPQAKPQTGQLAPKTSNNTPQASAKPATNPGLTNSGPGNTIAIFMAVSFSSAIIHWLIVRRKLYLNKT
jgi:hypothetical protein